MRVVHSFIICLSIVNTVPKLSCLTNIPHTIVSVQHNNGAENTDYYWLQLFENNKSKHAVCKTQTSEQRPVSVTTCRRWSNNAVSAATHISVCRDNTPAQIHTDNPPNTNKKIIFLFHFYISRWDFLNHRQAKYTVKLNTLMSLHVSVRTNRHPTACRTHSNTQTQQERRSLVLFKVYKNRIKDTYLI